MTPSNITLKRAENFLLDLPKDIYKPHVKTQGSGEIILTWVQPTGDNIHVFRIKFDESDQLFFCYDDPNAGGSGHDPCDNPEHAIRLLRLVLKLTPL